MVQTTPRERVPFNNGAGTTSAVRRNTAAGETSQRAETQAAGETSQRAETQAAGETSQRAETQAAGETSQRAEHVRSHFVRRCSIRRRSWLQPLWLERKLPLVLGGALGDLSD